MSTVKVENQVDFRKLRGNKDQRASDKSREKRKALKAAGLCTICGEEPVENRSTCRECVKNHMLHVERAVFRKHGVPLPIALLLPSELAALQIPF